MLGWGRGESPSQEIRGVADQPVTPPSSLLEADPSPGVKALCRCGGQPGMGPLRCPWSARGAGCFGWAVSGGVGSCGSPGSLQFGRGPAAAGPRALGKGPGAVPRDGVAVLAVPVTTVSGQHGSNRGRCRRLSELEFRLQPLPGRALVGGESEARQEATCWDTGGLSG